MVTLSDDDLRAMVRELFLRGDSSIPLPPDLNLVEAGICDSFALLELAMAVEVRLGGVRIPDSDVTVDNFGSIAGIQAYLAARSR
jgi:acyl carrier protein